MAQPESDRLAIVEPGWEVRDVNGELVGTVLSVAPSYVLVEQGRFFPDDVYLPLDVIETVAPSVVTLNVTGQAALDAGWHAGPPAGVGAFSTAYMAPGIMLGGQVEELGTSPEDAAPAAITPTATGSTATGSTTATGPTATRRTATGRTGSSRTTSASTAPSPTAAVSIKSAATAAAVTVSTAATPTAAAPAAEVFQPSEITYLEARLIGRLATVDAAGQPHVVPVTYKYNRREQTIDIGGPDFTNSKKYKDVAATGRVAFVVDDLDPNQVPRGIELRGRGELLRSGGRALDPQFDEALLRIHPNHIAHWGLGDDDRTAPA